MRRTRPVSNIQTSLVPPETPGQSDLRELVQRRDVADALKAVNDLLGVQVEVLLPPGEASRCGEETATSSLCVGGQRVVLAFHGEPSAEHQRAAATIAKGLLGLAFAVDDLAAGANYFNDRLEQVLNIVSKTGAWHEIDALARELLRHLREQFLIDRAFVILGPLGAVGPSTKRFCG